MIQDIAPKHLDITYHSGQPEEDSLVLFFREGTLLVLCRPDGENRIRFPEYLDVKEFCEKPAYLFSLEERLFFRAELQQGADTAPLLERLQRKYPLEQALFCKRSFFRTAAPKEYAFAAVTGLHLNGWYEKNRCCGVCGKPLAADEKERMLFCPACGNTVYPRIDPAVIVAVTDGDRLLLTKYRGREYKKYALVAGFNEIGETLEETAAREVREETGLSIRNLRYYKSQPWGFADNLLVGYFCEADGSTQIRMDPEELSAAEWVKRSEIPVEPEDMSLTNEMICRFKLDKE